MGLPPLTHESLTGGGGRSHIAARTAARTGGLWVAAAAVLGAVLLPVYDRLSATAPITADSANAVLQGQSMADGNVLLSGWTLSGASFFVTDLPFYAASTAIRGVSPLAAHDVGAIIYTLLVLAACFLAKGGARGAPALGRMAVTLLLLIAPAPGAAVQLLLLGPFHAGTTLLMLLGLLVLDSAGERWLGAVALGVLLALAQLSDALAIYVGVAPIVVVASMRLARARRRSDVTVLAAAVLSIPASLLLMVLIGQLGGFATVPIQASFAHIEDMPRNAALTVEGGLLLFGANFFGQPLVSIDTLSILVHLAGFAFVLVVCRWVVMAWRRGEEPDRVTQVLLVAMALDVAAHLFSNQAIDLMTSRYLIPFLTFGAVLAGRVGADRLWGGRLRSAAAAVGVAYVVFLGLSLRTPPAPAPEAQLAAFLERHQLTYGVAAYWQSSTVTVQSGGRVRVRAVQRGSPELTAYLWEAEGFWYDPRLAGNDARFVLRDTSDSRSVDRRTVEAAFGAPTDVYRIGSYEVLVWDRNLLDDLQ
jgi:4-amino-4-deoxy-L-arabinose transferase-like glycosyltransferase